MAVCLPVILNKIGPPRQDAAPWNLWPPLIASSKQTPVLASHSCKEGFSFLFFFFFVCFYLFSFGFFYFFGFLVLAFPTGPSQSSETICDLWSLVGCPMFWQASKVQAFPKLACFHGIQRLQDNTLRAFQTNVGRDQAQ